MKLTGLAKHYADLEQKARKNALHFESSYNAQREEIRLLQQELNQKDDWIERLLEYTKLSPDELQKLIVSEHKTSETMDIFKGLLNISSKFGLY